MFDLDAGSNTIQNNNGATSIFRLNPNKPLTFPDPTDSTL